MTTKITPAKSGAGAIIVFGFIWIVFDNLALALIGGLLAAGASARRARQQPSAGPNAADADGAA